jgi:uncharacterized protein
VSRTPREVAELVCRMVAGEDVVFADLFAADGVIAYPFAGPGHPEQLAGRDAIRSFFSAMGQARQLFVQEGVDQVIRETDDPEVVVTEITHYGRSRATGRPYRLPAIAVIRVRDGEIVQYDDYMNPVDIARMLGRTDELAAALASA